MPDKKQEMVRGKYAKCKGCEKEMVRGGNCDLRYLEINGQYFARIPHTADDCGPGGACHDCNAGVGKIPHASCDMERCPICGVGQALSCVCYSTIDWDKVDFANTRYEDLPDEETPVYLIDTLPPGSTVTPAGGYRKPEKVGK